MKIRLSVALLALFSSPSLAASPIEGSWINPKGSVTVLIAPCGEGLLCGRVTKASDKAIADAAAAGTPDLVGAELMSDLEQTGEDSWHGLVFVPDANRTAESDLRLLDARTLDIQGCAFAGFLCRSQQWTRVTAPAKPKPKPKRR